MGEFSPTAAYKILESFSLWDNHRENGEWQFAYSREGQLDFDCEDVVSFSCDYLNDNGVELDDVHKKAVPVLYSIGPVYSFKALSELNVGCYGDSEIFDRGVELEDVDSLIGRYDQLAVWRHLFKEEGNLEPKSEGLVFSSNTGSRLVVDCEKGCSEFEFGQFRKEMTGCKDSLRVVGLFLSEDKLPETGYECVENILSAMYTKPRSDEGFNILWDIETGKEAEEHYEVLRKGDFVDSMEEIRHKDEQSGEYEGLARAVCGMIESRLGVDFSHEFRDFFLAPRSYGEVVVFDRAMCSALNAFYPEQSFPRSNRDISKRIEEYKFKMLEEHVKPIKLSDNELKEFVCDFNEGVWEVELPKESSSDYSEINCTKLGGLRTRDRVLMCMFGEGKWEEVKQRFDSSHMELDLSPTYEGNLRIIKRKK